MSTPNLEHVSTTSMKAKEENVHKLEIFSREGGEENKKLARKKTTKEDLEDWRGRK